MRKQKNYQDERIKKKIFPIPVFVLSFIIFGTFTTVQMHIIGDVIDYQKVPTLSRNLIFLVWVLCAIGFTLITNFQIRECYQKPIEEFSEAAHKVASGDFSVYLAPRHTANRYTHLDVLFMDFNKMVEELGSIETLKTDFFTNVSHEIKTPISVIQNHAYLLQNQNLTEEQRKDYTDTIIQSTKKLSNLITNMLKLNKLEKQAINPMPQTYDLCAQLCETALMFEEIWEQKKIEFIVEMDDRVMITADEGLLELVWTNLLSNALKFTPACGTVTLTQTTDQENVIVSVKDTGCGMDEKTRKKIFEKFYQGDTSHSSEGNGLGLALVKRILELSEGTISVESEVGKGSTFVVVLPLDRSEEEGS